MQRINKQDSNTRHTVTYFKVTASTMTRNHSKTPRRPLVSNFELLASVFNTFRLFKQEALVSVFRPSLVELGWSDQLNSPVANINKLVCLQNSVAPLQKKFSIYVCRVICFFWNWILEQNSTTLLWRCQDSDLTTYLTPASD